MDSKDTLTVCVRSATKIVWEGNALSVSSQNSAGPFDVLPYHANFISLTRQAPIRIVDTEHKEHTFSFNQSVIYVQNNKVSVYADFN